MRAPQLDNRNRERTGVISQKSLELVNRYRDKTAMISRKHGNTLVRALRKRYGPGFAANFKDTDKLSDVLAELDTPSLTKLIRNFRVRAWTPQIAKKTKEWLRKNTESSLSYHGHVHVKMVRKHYVPLPAKTSEGSDTVAHVLQLSERTLCVSLNCSKTRPQRLTVLSAQPKADSCLNDSFVLGGCGSRQKPRPHRLRLR